MRTITFNYSLNQKNALKYSNYFNIQRFVQILYLSKSVTRHFLLMQRFFVCAMLQCRHIWNQYSSAVTIWLQPKILIWNWVKDKHLSALSSPADSSDRKVGGPRTITPGQTMQGNLCQMSRMKTSKSRRSPVWSFVSPLKISISPSSDFGYAENDGWVDKFGCWTKVFRHKLWVSAEKSATVAPRPRKLWSHRRTSIFSKNFKFPCYPLFFCRIMQISLPSLFP